MNPRGQIALEFMLLMVFVLVFISSTVLPSIELAGKTAQEIEQLAQARIATEKIAFTVNQLQTQSTGAKQTLLVFVPQDTNIFCNLGNIGFAFPLKGPPATACNADNDNDDSVCTKRFAIQANFSCIPGPVLAAGKQTATIVVERTGVQTTVKAQ